MMASFEDPHRIRKSSVALLFIAAFACMFVDGFELSSGLILGGLVSILNFHLIERIIKSSFRAGASQAGIAGRIGLKFLGLVLIVSMVLVWLPINPVGFAAGLSVVFLSIGMSGLLHLLKRPPAHSESPDA